MTFAFSETVCTQEGFCFTLNVITFLEKNNEHNRAWSLLLMRYAPIVRIEPPRTEGEKKVVGLLRGYRVNFLLEAGKR